MRVLYIPNEHAHHRQEGARSGFAKLSASGLLSEVRVYSFLLRIREGEGFNSVFRGLCALVSELRPDVVLIQHPGGTGLLSDHWIQLRKISPFTLVYHEGDAYDRWRKVLPPEAKAAAQSANLTLTVGASNQMSILSRAGARAMRWTPHSFDPMRFGMEAPIQVQEKEFDVVFIGNSVRSRMPGRSIPGVRDRHRLVAEMSKRFGRRFAVYGKGWTGATAQGPIAFADQERAVRSGWITANWDHYPAEAMYFSDRLPISLASGTVHVTTRHPGYDTVFPEETPFLHFTNRVADVTKRCSQLLDSLTPEAHQKAIVQGRDFALTSFREDDLLVEWLNAVGARIDPAAASEAWGLPVPMISEV